MIALMLLALVGCGNPVEDCNATTHDCCSEDAQCAAYFDDFPFCTGSRKSDGRGTCSLCAGDADCPSGQTCELADFSGTDVMYEDYYTCFE